MLVDYIIIECYLSVAVDNANYFEMMFLLLNKGESN